MERSKTQRPADEERAPPVSPDQRVDAEEEEEVAETHPQPAVEPREERVADDDAGVSGGADPAGDVDGAAAMRRRRPLRCKRGRRRPRPNPRTARSP